MFSLFKKDPIKALQKQYESTLNDAMSAQRKGDIRAYSELSDKSEKILAEIDSIKAATS